MKRIAVIGGGAAGFFAAVNIAEKCPQTTVTLFEAAPSPLRKVAISGGGRCNVTHACFDPARLVEFYPRGSRELRSLFTRFQPRDTIQWFKQRGLMLKTESDGRMFPVSDHSGDVISTLQNAAHQAGVLQRKGVRVTSIRYVEGEESKMPSFSISVAGEAVPESFDLCILSTGYSPTGWQLAASLGHTVLDPVPSLFPFTVKAPVIEGLQGLSILGATGTLIFESVKSKASKEEGPVLITHTGLSGPLIYRLSARHARELAESKYKATLRLDLLPEISEQALAEKLIALIKVDSGAKQLHNIPFAPFPQRLWERLIETVDLQLDQRGDTVTDKSLRRLASILKQLQFPVTGKSPSKEEFVSCGGVSRKEVDFKTMQSRNIPGLYFAGEILDIDGLTGGFNFQACWSGAWVLSEAVAASI